MEAPERIYLQIGLDAWEEPVESISDLEGVTWCVDRIDKSDIEYVRRDVAVRLREALRLALFWGDDWTGWQDEPKEIQPRIAYAETAFLEDSETVEENGESE